MRSTVITEEQKEIIKKLTFDKMETNFRSEINREKYCQLLGLDHSTLYRLYKNDWYVTIEYERKKKEYTVEYYEVTLEFWIGDIEVENLSHSLVSDEDFLKLYTEEKTEDLEKALHRFKTERTDIYNAIRKDIFENMSVDDVPDSIKYDIIDSLTVSDINEDLKEKIAKEWIENLCLHLKLKV